MYPAQTSLIPAQVALIRFWEEQGWRAIFSNYPSASSGLYPYWYLGSTPLRYLTGPILPSFLVFLHRLLPRYSLFEIMFGLIGVMWVIGVIGVYLLVVSLANSSTSQESRSLPRHLRGVSLARFSALLAALFYLFGPLVPFLFRFSDGLYLISFSVLPYVLIWYVRFLGEEKEGEVKRIKRVLLALIILVILLDTAIIPSMILGMAVIFLAQVGWKKAEEKLKKSLWLVAYGLLLATVWYTPNYWLVSFFGPSLAGKPRVEVIFQLSKLLPAALAIGVAIFSVKLFPKRNLLRDFCFYWLFIFGFLTLIRFISDPDFWLDWSSYYVELQLGLAVLGGLVVGRLIRKSQISNLNPFDKLRVDAEQSRSIKFQIHSLKPKSLLPLSCVFGIYFSLFVFTLNKFVIHTLQNDITQTVEYRIGKKLLEVVKPGERVFLSGTTAFWLNAFFDLSQVRGGRDQVSVHPTWRRAVWEVREGTDPEKSVKWLRDLEISWLVVHSLTSSEYYHDFTYPEKFEGVEGLKTVYDEGGDRIYRVL